MQCKVGGGGGGGGRGGNVWQLICGAGGSKVHWPPTLLFAENKGSTLGSELLRSQEIILACFASIPDMADSSGAFKMNHQP